MKRRDRFLRLRVANERVGEDTEVIEHIFPSRSDVTWWVRNAEGQIMLGNFSLVTAARRTDKKS